MLEPNVIERLQEDYKSLDQSLIVIISNEYDNEVDAREVLNSLNIEAVASDVDWSTFDNPTELQVEEVRQHNESNDGDEDLTDDLRFLKQSFPNLSLAIIKHKYRSCNGDLDKVTDLLLNQSLIDEEISDEDRYIQTFSRKSKRSDFSSSYKEQRREVEYRRNSIKSLSEILEISEEQASVMFDANEMSLTKCLLVASSSTGNSKVTSLAEPAAQYLKPALTYTQVASTGSKSRNNVGDLSELRGEAELAYDKRKEAILKALEMYRKSHSNPLYRSAAGYYASQASQHGLEGQEVMDDMYRTLIGTRSTMYEIDFHGVPMHVAVDVAIDKLQEWWAREGRNLGRPPLKLITGAGRHSGGGIPKIKNAIRKLLRERDWIFEEGTSYFLVTGYK